MTTSTRYLVVIALAVLGLLAAARSLHGSSSNGSSLTAAQARQAVTGFASTHFGIQVRRLNCRKSSYTGQYGETMFACTASYFSEPHAESHSNLWCVEASSGPAGPIASDEVCSKLPHA